MTQALSPPPLPCLPLAERFFAGALLGGALGHGYVLKGKASDAAYHLALAVAKILNCTERPALALPEGGRLADLACGQCKDCRWMAQNAHPAFMTVSRMTYVVDDTASPDLLSTEELEKVARKANWGTKIKTGQMERLIHHLSLSTGHTRVVVFTDAEERPASDPAAVTAPSEWRALEATQDRSFHIRPLTRALWSEEAVNRFLKTLEEPPPRLLFFFIVETEEQLMETIVSRCQVVPCFSEGVAAQTSLPEAHRTFLAGLLARLRQNGDAYELSAAFETFFVKEEGLNLSQALETLQTFLRERLLTAEIPVSQAADFFAYRQLQQAVNTALRMLAARTNESQSLLHLFFALGQHAPALPG